MKAFKEISHTEEFKRYAGNPYTSWRGMMFLIPPVAALLFLIIFKPTVSSTILFLLGFIVVMFFTVGYQLHYFLLSDNYLVVKNHFLFWIQRVYPVADISEINFIRSTYRWPKSVGVIGKNSRSNLYLSGSLRKRHWGELRKAFVKLRIHVRDLATEWS